MKRLLSILAIIGIALMVIPSTVASADVTKQEYESYTTGGDGDSQEIGSDNQTAMYFTTDNMSHTVTDIKMLIKKTGNPGTLTVALQEFSTTTTSPSGVDLCSGTLSDNVVSANYALKTIPVDEVTINGNSAYAIILRAEYGGASDYYEWQKDSGGGITNALSYDSTDGGLTWAADGTADCLFSIWGNPTLLIEDIAVFNGYLQGNDTLIVFKYLNTYSPYYPASNPGTYFDLQLLDTTGTNVLASTTLKDWGMRPGSIYLSASTSSLLTMGAQYYIRIYGQFAGNPYIETQLQSVDYKGTNLDHIDTWARGVAYDMFSYYNTAFIEYNAEKNDIVLNEEGGILFNNGVPSLEQVRPDLFASIKEGADIATPTPTNTFDTTETYRDALGDNIADMLDGMGSWFNVTGQTLGLVAVWISWAILSLIILLISHRTNNTMDIGLPVCAGLAFPVIGVGAWVHLMSIEVIIVSVIFAAVVLGFSLILTRL